MKTSLTFCLLLFAFQGFSCSDAHIENSVVAANSSTERSDENRSTPLVSSQSNDTNESRAASTSREEVISSGKDYVKKSGWAIPSGAETDVTERQTDMGITTDGKAVEVMLIFHDYKTPKSYSENFHYAGPNLDNMKGRLRSGGFTDYSVNGRVFMYSVFAEKIVPPPASNSDPHQDPFVYQIQDADGDGVFETLLGDYDKIIVPNWVLK